MHVTPADVRDRNRVAAPAEEVQEATGGSVDLAQVYQGDNEAAVKIAAADEGINLEVVRLPDAKQGFVPLPRRRVVERSLGWAARFHRLAKDYERLTETPGGCITSPSASSAKRHHTSGGVHNTLKVHIRGSREVIGSQSGRNRQLPLADQKRPRLLVGPDSGRLGRRGATLRARVAVLVTLIGGLNANAGGSARAALLRHLRTTPAADEGT